MNSKTLLAQIYPGEDSARQFKADVTNPESLASEMAAFASAEGGTIYIGVADDGSTVKRYLQHLKREGRIQRVGSKKSGHWEILP